ncbi:MAG: hypothetical protein GC187_10115 [Alphaproteobacteria bacterium]|nr:hypothetical protein [Alphaproteobacteria bacterium]
MGDIMRAKARISWRYNRRASVFTGADASIAEVGLSLAAALAAPLCLGLLVWRELDPSWAPWQWIVAAVLAADIAGGVVSNATNAQKRLIFSSPNDHDGALTRWIKRWPLMFAIIHVQPFILMPAFGAGLAYAAGWYGAALAGSALIYATPLHLRRPVAFGVVAAGVIADLYFSAAPAGMEWFAILFLIKLTVCHAVREEPYTPGGRAD